MARHDYDAVVVGSGPNGLAAAIALAERGHSVLVVEAAPTLGGGTRTAELTLPGFAHDVCSSVHPMAVSSPFFRRLPLDRYGLEWVQPPTPFAHPLDDGTAVVLERSVEATAAGLGQDGGAYRRLFGPLARTWGDVSRDVLGPLRLPRHPIATARFGLSAVRSASGLARATFKGERARALMAGACAHSMLPLDRKPSAAFGIVLMASGHAVGWPFPRGGAQRIGDALVAHLRSLGGETVVGQRVSSLDELPRSGVTLLDLSPRGVLEVAGDRLPEGYRRRLEAYRYGPGVCNVHWALSGPIPWRAEECARAATVHLGGTLEEIEESERAPFEGRTVARPYVLLTQPSLFDPTRAPAGMHAAWGYCHLPNGSTHDATAEIEAQVERFAPGFRDRILARHTMTAADFDGYNANYVGGDINAGTQDLRQLFTRPAGWRAPYTTPAKGLYICSSSTPPGGGVHGMCGYFAARAALRELE